MVDVDIGNILLRNEMVNQHVRPVELVRKLVIRSQKVTRLLMLKYPAKTDTICNALRAMGKTFDLVVH